MEVETATAPETHSSTSTDSGVTPDLKVKSQQFSNRYLKSFGAGVAALVLIGLMGVAGIFSSAKYFRAFNERAIELQSAINLGVSLDNYSQKVQALDAELNKIKLDLSSGELLSTAERIVRIHKGAYRFWNKNKTRMDSDFWKMGSFVGEYEELAEDTGFSTDTLEQLGSIKRDRMLQTLWMYAEREMDALKQAST